MAVGSAGVMCNPAVMPDLSMEKDFRVEETQHGRRFSRWPRLINPDYYTDKPVPCGRAFFLQWR